MRQYVYSFRDMVKTTSLKIRRQVEITGIQELLERQKVRLRELTGRNLDTIGGADSAPTTEPAATPDCSASQRASQRAINRASSHADRWCRQPRP